MLPRALLAVGLLCFTLGCADWYARLGEAAASGGDYQTAAARFERAAEAGNHHAELQLAMLYYQGLGVEQSFETALYWFYRAAKAGNEYAQYRLGRIYEKGEGAPVNYQHSIYWYGLAARAGEPLADVALGELYLAGKGVERNRLRALRHFASAADAGNAHAQFLTAQIYAQEGGDAEDVDRLRRAAAQQNHALAQVALGRDLGQGPRRPDELKRAEEWLRRAATQGNITAQHELAVLLGEKGELREASRLLRGAAEADYLPAQIDLAESLLADGEPASSAAWFRKAAEGGNAYAQFRFGELLADGRGVEHDRAQAMIWLRRASEKMPAAARRLEEVAAGATPAQRQEAGGADQ